MLYSVAWSLYFGLYPGDLLADILKTLKWIQGYQFSYPKSSLRKNSKVHPLGSIFQPDRRTATGVVLSN